MKNKPNRHYFSFLFILFFELSYTQEIIAEFNLEKAVFLTGEPIFATVKLKNVSIDTFDYSGYDVGYHLYKSSGDRMTSGFSVDYGPRDWEPIFHPNESLEFYGQLAGEFAQDCCPSQLPFGKYKVQWVGTFKGTLPGIEGGPRNTVITPALVKRMNIHTIICPINM